MQMTSSIKREQDRQSRFVMDALDKYERPLTRYAARLLSADLSAARDVVQHVFLKLCEQDRQTIEDRVAAWLYRVCRNRAVDVIRGRSGEEQLATDDVFQPSQNGQLAESNPATIVEEAEFSEKLRSLIDELTIVPTGSHRALDARILQ